MTTHSTIREQVEAHAAACRAAVAAGEAMPAWRGGSLSGAGLSSAALRGADMRATVMSGADLRNADLSGADLRGAVLRGAVLRRAVLSSAALRRADLSGADLSGADLSSATMCFADLRGADLRAAILSGADLSSADLRGADMRGAHVTEGTVAAHAAGIAGDHRWHALRMEDGSVVLHYGCDRAPLSEWRQRGPEYGARHGCGPDHWAIGPAVAIAAASALEPA